MNINEIDNQIKALFAAKFLLFKRLETVVAHIEHHQRIVAAFQSGERPAEGNESDSMRERDVTYMELYTLTLAIEANLRSLEGVKQSI